jgi:hypothetical protein
MNSYRIKIKFKQSTSTPGLSFDIPLNLWGIYKGRKLIGIMSKYVFLLVDKYYYYKFLNTFEK